MTGQPLGFGLFIDELPRANLLRLRAAKPKNIDIYILLDKRSFQAIKQVGNKFWPKKKKRGRKSKKHYTTVVEAK